LGEELLASQQGLCTTELVRIFCLHSDLNKTGGFAVKSLLTFFLFSAFIYLFFFIFAFFLWSLELKFFALFWDSTAAVVLLG
jgi:hypothetical protein